jgi:hypothetical protein
MTAPQLAVNHCIQAPHASSYSNGISHKQPKTSLSPLLRPQALLMNTDVLVRASLAERHANQGGFHLSALPRPTFTIANHTIMAAALAAPLDQDQRHEQHHTQLQCQLLQLQRLQKAQVKPHAANGIIGMGIQVPLVDPLAAAAPITMSHVDAQLPQACPLQATPQNKALRMMEIGKPLLAPPRLANATFKPAKTIQPHSAVPPKKRTVSALSLAPLMTQGSTQSSVCTDQDTIPRPLQRRKLNHPPAPRRVSPIASSKTILSSDELDFVVAAQRLQQCHGPLDAPKKLSLMMPPRLLLKDALKSPPTLSR